MNIITKIFGSAWRYITDRVKLENIFESLRGFEIQDVIDVFIVSILLFYVIRFMRDRRAGKLGIGVLLLFVLRVVSEIFELATLSFMMDNVIQVGMLAVIVVFQPELRLLLENVGGDSIRGLRSIGEQKESVAIQTMIHSLCDALTEMAEAKTGALVVIERENKLNEIIATGTVVNSDMKAMMLKSIFFNNAPLHDGAVIIRGGRIYAAGCVLPLTQKSDVDKNLGTRHRAAIGMSENSDAVVFVVSEETGIISMAAGGKLTRGLDYTSLHIELDNLFTHPQRGKRTVKQTLKDKVVSFFGKN